MPLVLQHSFVESILKEKYMARPNMGELIFAGAHLCNGISVVDNDLYMC